MPSAARKPPPTQRRPGATAPKPRRPPELVLSLPADTKPRNAYALVNSINKAARGARATVEAQAFPAIGDTVVFAIKAAPATTTDLARAVTYAQRYAKMHGLQLEPVVFMMCKR